MGAPLTRLQPTVNSHRRPWHGGTTPKIQRLTRLWPRWHAPDGFDDLDEPDHWRVVGMPNGASARLVRSADKWEIHRLINGSWTLCPGLYANSLSALGALEEMVFQPDCDH